MSSLLQVGHQYRMKTYTHDFLDVVTVVSSYTSSALTTVYVLLRSNGHVVYMTEADVRAADHYPVPSVNDPTDEETSVANTEALTDWGDEPDPEPEPENEGEVSLSETTQNRFST